MSALPLDRTYESGKYRTLTRLGQGGMADVFLAVARGPAGFNKLVVIKRLKEDLASDPEHRSMFLDEARLAARLSHPNVVQTYEVTEDAGVYFITMEYLDGQPLNAIMREAARLQKKLPMTMAAHVCAEVLAGLDYAHELCDFDGNPLKIVHRDVSPQNVFLTYDGQVKLVDFGIAKAEVSKSKTQAGVLKGKASYMAPEQLLGEVDRRTDIFTTGIILWELVTGRRLMAGKTTGETLLRVVRESAGKPSEVDATVDPALEAIIMRALDREPSARWQTAREMRVALERYIESTGNFVRQEEVAQLVKGMFGAQRAEAMARIKEQMALLPAHASGTMPAVRLDSQSSLRVAVLHPMDQSASGLSTGAIGNFQLSSPIGGTSSSAAIPVGLFAPHAPAPPRRGRWLAAIALVVAAAGAGGYFARARVAPPPAPAPAPAPPPPVVEVAAPAPTPVAPAPPSAAPLPSASASAAPEPAPKPAAAPPRPVWHAPVHAPPPPAPPASTAPPAPVASPSPAPAPPAPTTPPTTTSTGRRIRTDL